MTADPIRAAMSNPRMWVEWQHPVRGRIAEVTCPTHREWIIDAFDMLGIGALSYTAADDHPCTRCWAARNDVDVRDWMTLAPRHGPGR